MANSDEILGTTVSISAGDSAALLAARLAAISPGGEGVLGGVSGDAMGALRAQAEQNALSALLGQGRRDLDTPKFEQDFDALASQHFAQMQADATTLAAQSSRPALDLSSPASPPFPEVSALLDLPSGRERYSQYEALYQEKYSDLGRFSDLGKPPVISAYPALLEAAPPRYSALLGERYGAPSGGYGGGIGGGGGYGGEGYSGSGGDDGEFTDGGGINIPFTGPGGQSAGAPGFVSRFGASLRGFGSRAMSNMAEDWNDPSGYGKLNYAYAGQSFLQSAGKDYAEQNSGKYLTPEERETANAGLLPGVFGVAGVAIGSMIAPGVGSWAGGMVGAGVGQGIQGIIGANDERNQSARQASQQMDTVTGAATAALERFTEQINSSSAATKELQTAIGTVTGAAPGAGMGTITGAAFMSGALGERFNPALSGFESAVGSDAILRGIQPGLAATGGALPASQYADSAVALAAMGDWQGRNNALTLQGGALTDPKYAKDANNADRAGGWGGVEDLFTNWHQVGRDVAGQWKHYHTNEQQYLPGADAARKAAADDSANVYGLYLGASSADEVAKTGISLADTRLRIGEATGQSDAQLAETAQGIYSSVSANAPRLTAQASGLTSYLASHPNLDPTARLSLEGYSCPSPKNVQ